MKKNLPNYIKQIKGSITAPTNYLASGVHCGIKKNKKKDLALIFSKVPACCAAVFTTNKFKAAPVLVSEQQLHPYTAQAILINSGNANAITGYQGIEDVWWTIHQVEEALGIPSQNILVGSTGVIGVPLPLNKMGVGIKKAAKALSRTGGDKAAEAIMTTDLTKKQIALEVKLTDGKKIKIGGIAKGSGMIGPSMATMLSVITTDAKISPLLLRGALKDSVNNSFNMISVDNDTSTNDTVFALANGAAGNVTLVKNSEDFVRFKNALDYVCQYLAKEIVKDGEGATKFIEVKVTGAKSKISANKIALKVVSSSLVKTAIFGKDPNWGRFLMAAGNAGVEINQFKVNLKLGNLLLVENGEPTNYKEADAKKMLKKKDVYIEIGLKAGSAEGVAWGCDLSYDYVKINASYRS